MNKDKNKTIMIVALISILICGCPGCVLLFTGITSLADAIGDITSFEDLLSDLGDGFVRGGWTLCLSAVLILIPFVLAIIAVLVRNKKPELEELEPTGVSKDDPLPPTS